MNFNISVHPKSLRARVERSGATAWVAFYEANEIPAAARLAIYLRTPREIAAFERLAADLAAADAPAEAEAV